MSSKDRSSVDIYTIMAQSASQIRGAKDRAEKGSAFNLTTIALVTAIVAVTAYTGYRLFKRKALPPPAGPQ